MSATFWAASSLVSPYPLVTADTKAIASCTDDIPARDIFVARVSFFMGFSAAPNADMVS